MERRSAGLESSGDGDGGEDRAEDDDDQDDEGIPLELAQLIETLQFATRQRFGPTPDPEELRQLQVIDPSFPERTIRMAEATRTDQSKRDDKFTDAEVEVMRAAAAEGPKARRTIAYLIFAAMVGAGTMGAIGEPWLGAAFLSFPVAYMISLIRPGKDRGAPPPSGPPALPPGETPAG